MCKKTRFRNFLFKHRDKQKLSIEHPEKSNPRQLLEDYTALTFTQASSRAPSSGHVIWIMNFSILLENHTVVFAMFLHSVTWRQKSYRLVVDSL